MIGGPRGSAGLRAGRHLRYPADDGLHVQGEGDKHFKLHFLQLSWRKYRVAHLVADLGWVDLDFDCSTVCPILPGLIRKQQKGLGNWATQPRAETRWANHYRLCDCYHGTRIKCSQN